MPEQPIEISIYFPCYGFVWSWQWGDCHIATKNTDPVSRVALPQVVDGSLHQGLDHELGVASSVSRPFHASLVPHDHLVSVAAQASLSVECKVYRSHIRHQCRGFLHGRTKHLGRQPKSTLVEVWAVDAGALRHMLH